jgi:protoheme IX farnesyltransferase
MTTISEAPPVELRSGDAEAVEEEMRTRAGITEKPGLLRIYLALMKPKIIVLLLITTASSMMVAAGGLPNLRIFFWTLVGGTLSAGGANALNHFFDRDIDYYMYRTKRRPLPSGWISPRSAVLFGLALCALAFTVFTLQVNLLAAVLSLIGALYYIIIYTLWLKRRTPHNITIGGVAGAIPPLVGWAAVTGSLAPTAWALFAIVFFWTPPHTWALTLMVKKDYARADVPMLPVVAGEEETRRQILIYSWLFVAVTLLPVLLGMFSWVYLAVALVTGAIHMADAYRIRRERTNASARSLYKYSLLHLALLFLAMVVDARLLG